MRTCWAQFPPSTHLYPATYDIPLPQSHQTCPMLADWWYPGDTTQPPTWSTSSNLHLSYSTTHTDSLDNQPNQHQMYWTYHIPTQILPYSQPCQCHSYPSCQHCWHTWPETTLSHAPPFNGLNSAQNPITPIVFICVFLLFQVWVITLLLHGCLPPI